MSRKDSVGYIGFRANLDRDMIEILAPISPADLIDRLTILRLKAERIEDLAKLANVKRELARIEAIVERVFEQHEELRIFWSSLHEINDDLWQLNNDLRAFEARGDFGTGYIALARSLRACNDRRAALKKQINLLFNSSLVEEKSHPDTHQTH